MAKNPKMVMCRNCGALMAANAKLCPACGAKNKKPFYKRVWFLAIVVIAAAGIIGSVGRNQKESAVDETSAYLWSGSFTAPKAAKDAETREDAKRSDKPTEESGKQSAEPEESAEETRRDADPKPEESAEETRRDADPKPEESAEKTRQDADPKPEETQTEESKPEDGGIDPDFKAAMDSYEAFVDEYIAFMKKLEDNPSDLELLADYADYLNRYAEAVSNFEKWDRQEMNAEETAYYIEVQTRVNKKLLEIS